MIKMGWIGLGQYMYIKHLAIPNLMDIHGKFLNALQINNLIQHICVHVYMFALGPPNI
jgi:hypothetical protein